MLDKIISFINDRPILLVGAAIDLDGHDIEFDGVIVRMNTSRRWGNCDLWFLNSSISRSEFLESKNELEEKYIIRGNGDRQGTLQQTKSYPEEWVGHTYFWDYQCWEDMVEEIKIPRPLTGTIAAYWFLKYTNSELTLLNFDCFEKFKVNPVRKTRVAPVHSPELDKAYLLSQERIKMVSMY